MTKKIKTIKRYLLSIPAYRGVYPERQHSKKNNQIVYIVVLPLMMGSFKGCYLLFKK